MSYYVVRSILEEMCVLAARVVYDIVHVKVLARNPQRLRDVAILKTVRRSSRLCTWDWWESALVVSMARPLNCALIE
jgi:hypothetical protein